MAFTIATTTESAESVKAAADHYDYDVNVETIMSGLPGETTATSTPPPAATEPAKEEPATTEGTTPPTELETVEPQAETDEGSPEHKKLLKRIDKLTANWRMEQGKTEEMRRQYDARISELTAQIEGQKPATPPDATAPAEPEEDQKPDRPKRPKLEDHDFDQSAYEEAVAKYEDEQIPEYEAKLLDWSQKDTLAKVEQKRRDDAARAEQERVDAEYKSHLDKLPGVYEALKENKVSIPQVAFGVLQTWDDQGERALLVNYLAHHPDEAEAITRLTITPDRRPNDIEFAHLASVSARHLHRLLPKAEAFAQQETKPPAPKPVAPPPAQPKPPVSAAPKPITPVTVTPNGTQAKPVEEMTAAEYAAMRTAQKQAARRR
jgi:hypothetical protein